MIYRLFFLNNKPIYSIEKLVYWNITNFNIKYNVYIFNLIVYKIYQYKIGYKRFIK